MEDSFNQIHVEKCTKEFFNENVNRSYELFKNPRGQCLIVNIYQIEGMPPRRWSDRDTDMLRQLFEQLMFNVNIYTDTTHDLTCKSLIKILQEFSQLSEHIDAQCCVICLMSHGEEGYLTTKEGHRILLDDIFSMFNNVNCPSLAGKPKIFLIQSCRDDPVYGPAEDLGTRIHFKKQSINELSIKNETHESDGHESSSTKQEFYHVPSLCDMVIGYPTQKGFIAYRKPEIGSWYMNAICKIFSEHAWNTDLCAMLNMVNAMISNEVTNTGKKQMSEYTSKLTKPYFFFYPGLSFENRDQIKPMIELNSLMVNRPLKKRKLSNPDGNGLTQKQMMVISEKARGYWKEIGRELEIGEVNIRELENCVNDNLYDKMFKILTIWTNKRDSTQATFSNFLKILSDCNLNLIRQELLCEFNL